MAGRIALVALVSIALAACGRSHRTDEEEGSDAGRRDAAPVPRSDAGPPVTPPVPGPCGGEPAAPECRRLCDEACAAFAACGGDHAPCLAGCYDAYACPGETPGHDAAICGSTGFLPRGCDETCAWVATYGGFGEGPSCPDDPEPEPDPCRGRSYCDCTGGCEPLIDLTPGCICECDEPFNCSGETCACVCGGATYLGCAPAGECPEPRVTCSDPSGATLVDGCPACEG